MAVILLIFKNVINIHIRRFEDTGDNTCSRYSTEGGPTVNQWGEEEGVV